MALKPRIVRHAERGFTLVELLAVVVITAVLSLVAVQGFRRHMQAARGSEARAVIQAIRSAQESYMAENHQYLNVSTTNGGANWYPHLEPSGSRSSFNPANHLNHPDYLGWRQLAAPVRDSVRFGYLVTAGVPGTSIPTLVGFTAAPAFNGPQAQDWYVIQAAGDADHDGKFARYASSSITGEIYVENETD